MPTPFAMYDSEEITQPFNSTKARRATSLNENSRNLEPWPVQPDFQTPAARAEVGRKNNLGPPRQQPFPNQNNVLSPEPTSLPEPGLEPGREPLPPEVNGRLAPPVTKGAPTTPSAPSQPPEPTTSHLTDHDYIRQPSAVLDHDYFARPPPGFNTSQGRPTRQTKLPAKYSDYEIY